jgi:hypothetical protein
MAAYVILTGQIEPGVLYINAGAQSVVYASNTYSTGQTFRGVYNNTSFTYTGSGTQIVNEVCEFSGGDIEFNETYSDEPVFADATILKGFNIEYQLNSAEEIVNETTKITGFDLELLDYPFYGFQITKRLII